jgi:hypothetical protein
MNITAQLTANARREKSLRFMIGCLFRSSQKTSMIKGPEAERDQYEAHIVDLQALGQKRLAVLHHLRAVAHKVAGQRERQQAHRQIHEEDPVPRVVVGDPAADHRADGGCCHHRQAVDRERHRALGLRKGVGEHALLHRRQASAAEALNHAENQEHGQRGRETAHQRAGREQRHAAHIKTLAADHARKPAADRQDDRVADQVARRDVGALVEARSQRTRDVPQGHVGDRGVQDLHERRDRDDDGDQPWIVRTGGRARQPFKAGACRHSQRT